MLVLDVKIGKGYPKLKKMLYEQDLISDITKILNITESKLKYILDGENGEDFTHKQAILICNYFNISADEYFF